MEGMYLESVTSANPVILDQWLDLIHAYAIRLTQQLRGQDRLWRLWADVDTNLARSWTLESMASSVAMSQETVRRLCLQQFGRSPMQHLTHLRMTRAAAMLQSTPYKLYTIARSVGYASSFAFSAAFKRWAGVSPEAYRQRAAS
jgi:transcriptional regulator GlxA family with amidase domain